MQRKRNKNKRVTGTQGRGGRVDTGGAGWSRTEGASNEPGENVG